VALERHSRLFVFLCTLTFAAQEHFHGTQATFRTGLVTLPGRTAQAATTNHFRGLRRRTVRETTVECVVRTDPEKENIRGTARTCRLATKNEQQKRRVPRSIQRAQSQCASIIH
jgi:hypothetical protein